MSVKIKIDDRDAVKLRQAFQEMQVYDQKKIFNAALRKATRPTVLAGKSNAPVGKTGNLKRSIGTIIPRNEVAIIIGARRRGGFKGHHGTIVEEGTVARQYTTKLGNIHRTGRMKGSGSYAHFLSKAVRSTEPHVLNTMGDEWYKSIQKFMAKHAVR